MLNRISRIDDGHRTKVYFKLLSKDVIQAIKAIPMLRTLEEADKERRELKEQDKLIACRAMIREKNN